MDISELESKTLNELRGVAKQWNIPNASRYKKDELIVRLLRANAEKQGLELRGGVLEIVEDGIGFLRSDHYLPGHDDIYVTQSQIRRFGLRTGDLVIGQVRPPKDREKYFGLLRVETVNGLDPEAAKRRPNFETLTPIFPEERFNLETDQHVLSTALINLIAPIGKGQRGLIVSPPKAGKTTILKQSGQRHLHQLSRRAPDGRADRRAPGRSHRHGPLGGRRSGRLDLRRAGDSTTCAWPKWPWSAPSAWSKAGGTSSSCWTRSPAWPAPTTWWSTPSGRTLSGGMDPAALYPPKRFFGAARNIEEGGSLTIIATCLVDTGSRMDDVIYEEFKGTGNMELHLPASCKNGASSRPSTSNAPPPAAKNCCWARISYSVSG